MITMERQAGNLNHVFIRETEVIVIEVFCGSPVVSLTTAIEGSSETDL